MAYEHQPLPLNCSILSHLDFLKNTLPGLFFPQSISCQYTPELELYPRSLRVSVLFVSSILTIPAMTSIGIETRLTLK